MDTNNSMEENVRLSALLSWVSADQFKIRLYSSVASAYEAKSRTDACALRGHSSSHMNGQSPELMVLRGKHFVVNFVDVYGKRLHAP